MWLTVVRCCSSSFSMAARLGRPVDDLPLGEDEHVQPSFESHRTGDPVQSPALWPQPGESGFHNHLFPLRHVPPGESNGTTSQKIARPAPRVLRRRSPPSQGFKESSFQRSVSPERLLSSYVCIPTAGLDLPTACPGLAKRANLGRRVPGRCDGLWRDSS